MLVLTDIAKAWALGTWMDHVLGDFSQNYGSADGEGLSHEPIRALLESIARAAGG